MTVCTCGEPPAISNGRVLFSGPFINGSSAEYACDRGYVNVGAGTVLSCIIGTNCSNVTWYVNTAVSNAGTPSCHYYAPNTNTYSSFTIWDDQNGWPVLGALIALSSLLVMLLCMFVCCACRNTDLSLCHCCLPRYSNFDSESQMSSKRSPSNIKQWARRYLYQARQSLSGSSIKPTQPVVDGYCQPKDFVQLKDSKLALPQGKPVNTKGQPVWMPHANNVRVAYKTSTK